MPSGDKPEVVDNRDGTVSVKYEPKQEGVHELILKHNGEHVQGSPFKFHVDSIASGYVTAYGSGLVQGVTGELANFTISTKNAGAGSDRMRGKLSLAVDGPSQVKVNSHDNKDGTVSASYLPTAPGVYKVSVKFGDSHIKGSPYLVKITGEGRKRNQISMGGQSEVALPGKVMEKDIKLLNASTTAPSGLEEPCFLKKLPNDHLGISFTPREVGQHLVTVKKKGTQIAGSPFKIMVSPKEVGDATKVKVSGALTEGKSNAPNKISINTKEAGYGGLSLSIEGPSKAEIKCDEKGEGELEVTYTPKEPGFYIINLKFADHHVKGSPFTCKVTGEGSNTQVERIKRERQAPQIAAVDTKCSLTFKLPGISALELSASVASPGGVVEDASITEHGGVHAVHFTPKELGVHTVSVKFRDVHIPGSPFPYTVGPFKEDSGAHRVHAGGPGLERGQQGQPNEFNVWTREAGAGSLSISVEGPSKAHIDFKDREEDGSCYVSYKVSEPGEYRVGIKFNDSHIPDSPYRVYITPDDEDARKVTVGQLPDAGVQIDKPIIFTVDRGGCKGQLDCKVVNPSGHYDDCFAQYLDEDTYSVRFLPKEGGIHQLHVKWNHVHVPGSPFRLKIGKTDADPAAVHAHGKGLERGRTGQKADFIINTCSAGTGTLATTIEGPSKVAMDCTEVDEGYKVRYTPLNPGEYFVSIKYDGYHISGSPFKVEIDGDELAEKGPKEQSSVVVETVPKTAGNKQEKHVPHLPEFHSDASKVTSKGMGLKKAFIGRQNQFSVDAGVAGQDMLWVACFGPKNPCEEIHVKHMGRNQYQVHYTVKERGKHILVARWGKDDIPGSPFEIEV